MDVYKWFTVYVCQACCRLLPYKKTILDRKSGHNGTVLRRKHWSFLWMGLDAMCMFGKVTTIEEFFCFLSWYSSTFLENHIFMVVPAFIVFFFYYFFNIWSMGGFQTYERNLNFMAFLGQSLIDKNLLLDWLKWRS